LKYLENYNFIRAVYEITEMEVSSLAVAKHLKKQDAIIFTYSTQDVWSVKTKWQH
jgi:glycerol-3-phosphate dehydrogenase